MVVTVRQLEELRRIFGEMSLATPSEAYLHESGLAIARFVLLKELSKYREAERDA